MWFKKTTAFTVAMMMILSLGLNVYADGTNGVGDNGDTGGGSSHSGYSSRYTWVKAQSGYRFTIVDKNFKPVSNSVDLTFNNPSSYNYGNNNINFYVNSRASSLKSRTKGDGHVTRQFSLLLKGNVIGKVPPTPIMYPYGNNKVES